MRRFVLPFAVLAISMVGAAHADTIYSTFGPGHTFNSANGYDLDALTVAAPFIPSEMVTVTDAVFALHEFSSSVIVYFESSSVAGLPDAILDTLTEVPNPAPGFQLVDFTCSVCPVLTAGTTYFAVAQKPFPLGFSFLALSPAAAGTVYINEFSSPTGPWIGETATFPAFEVNGTPPGTAIPEPSTLALLVTGLTGTAVAIRRRMPGVRVVVE